MKRKIAAVIGMVIVIVTGVGATSTQTQTTQDEGATSSPTQGSDSSTAATQSDGSSGSPTQGDENTISSTQDVKTTATLNTRDATRSTVVPPTQGVSDSSAASTQGGENAGSSTQDDGNTVVSTQTSEDNGSPSQGAESTATLTHDAAGSPGATTPTQGAGENGSPTQGASESTAPTQGDENASSPTQGAGNTVTPAQGATESTVAATQDVGISRSTAQDVVNISATTQAAGITGYSTTDVVFTQTQSAVITAAKTVAPTQSPGDTTVLQDKTTPKVSPDTTTPVTTTTISPATTRLPGSIDLDGVFFDMEMTTKFLQPFVVALNDTSSPEFAKYAADIRNWINGAFSGCPGFIKDRTVVHQFRNGSIIAVYNTSYSADYVLRTPDSYTHISNFIRTTSFARLLEPTTELKLTIDEIYLNQTTSAELQKNSDLLKSYTENPCSHAPKCPSCQYCTPELTCVSNCAEPSETCYVKNSDPVAEPEEYCGCATNYLPAAGNCIHQNVIIGVFAGVGGAIFVALIVALIVLLYRRRRTKQLSDGYSTLSM